MGHAQFGSRTLAGSAGEPNVVDVNPFGVLSEGDSSGVPFDVGCETKPSCGVVLLSHEKRNNAKIKRSAIPFILITPPKNVVMCRNIYNNIIKAYVLQ